MVKDTKDEYVKNVEVDKQKVRVRRCTRVEAIPKVSEEEFQNSSEPPKIKKIHHMTLKALQRKKHPLPSNSSQAGQKRKYIRKNYGKIPPNQINSLKQVQKESSQQSNIKMKNVQLHIKDYSNKNIEEVPSILKKKGRKRKVVLQISKQTSQPKTYTIPQTKTYDNYKIYFQRVMTFKNKKDERLIFNREDSNYSQFLRSIDL